MSTPHVFSFDDAPFDKFRDPEVLTVGVVSVGGSLVEGLLTTTLPVDGDSVTDRLATWITESRFVESLRVVLCEGITIAGLSVIHLPMLHEKTALPVISVKRTLPQPDRLKETLRQTGFADRIEAVEAAGPFYQFTDLFFTCAGISQNGAQEILSHNRGRSRLPEGIRLAHLAGQAIVLGESKGRP